MGNNTFKISPPHADVRLVCSRLYEMQTWLSQGGLSADVIEDARRMLTELSERVYRYEKREREG